MCINKELVYIVVIWYSHKTEWWTKENKSNISSKTQHAIHFDNYHWKQNPYVYEGATYWKEFMCEKKKYIYIPFNKTWQEPSHFKNSKLTKFISKIMQHKCLTQHQIPY